MLLHFSTDSADYFIHSHEIRRLEAGDSDVIIYFCQPVGSKPNFTAANTKAYISTDEVANMHKMILEAVLANENISIHVKSFKIL